MRAGYRTERFSTGGMRGYAVSHAPMVATPGPYTGETAYLPVGETSSSFFVAIIGPTGCPRKLDVSA